MKMLLVLTSDGRVLDWLTLYPIEQLSNLDRLVSMHDQRRFRQLFPILGPHAAVAGLVQPIANSINNNVSPHAVVNHPWEWTEYLGDASIQPHQGLSVKSTTSNFVKNSASLSLDLFSAENTGETRSTLTASNELVPEEFYDKISAQTIFMRSWLAERLPSNGMDINTAQVRSAQDDRSAEAHMWSSSMPSSLRVNATSAVQSGSRPGSRTASPTSAVHRGPWFQAPTRASPVGMGLTPQMVGTPGGSRQAVKRKAQPDEDLPMSEGSATSTSATQASAKPRPAGRASGHRQ
jgi:mediator of RNA polymerase II transcription subunit 12